MQLMLQATVCDCLALDPFAFEEDGFGSSEVDVGRREIAQAVVIAGMVVMSHEGGLTFEIAGQVIVLEQDAVLERLMPALDLALGLRVIRGAADVLYFFACSATPQDPLRRMTRRYPTTSAAGERRSSAQGLRPPMPGRAWRSHPALSSSRRAFKR
jgi:hypothetical protein